MGQVFGRGHLLGILTEAIRSAEETRQGRVASVLQRGLVAEQPHMACTENGLPTAKSLGR